MFWKSSNIYFFNQKSDLPLCACHLKSCWCWQQEMAHTGQRTTKLMGMGPMPINPGPDLVCRMAANSFAQVGLCSVGYHTKISRCLVHAFDRPQYFNLFHFSLVGIGLPIHSPKNSLHGDDSLSTAFRLCSQCKCLFFHRDTHSPLCPAVNTHAHVKDLAFRYIKACFNFFRSSCAHKSQYMFVPCVQARVQYQKDLASGKNTGMATMAWARTMAAAHANGC